jgi:hypothetical protein
MSRNFKHRPGISSAGAYQVSGIPYASASHAVIPANDSSSPWQVTFPTVTKWVLVENRGQQPLRVGFSSIGVRGLSEVGSVFEKNYFVLDTSGSTDGTLISTNPTNRIYLDIRVKDLFLLSDGDETGLAQVVAGLTMVDTEELTGAETGRRTNWSGSSGVG